MANNIAFQPMGNCVAVSATGAANTQSNIFTITATSPVNQYYIVNDSPNNNVYVWISSSNSFNVALPQAASTQVIPLPAYGYRVITGPQVSSTANVYARVIGDGANATCYVTPGEGL